MACPSAVEQGLFLCITSWWMTIVGSKKWHLNIGIQKEARFLQSYLRTWFQWAHTGLYLVKISNLLLIPQLRTRFPTHKPVGDRPHSPIVLSTCKMLACISNKYNVDIHVAYSITLYGLCLCPPFFWEPYIKLDLICLAPIVLLILFYSSYHMALILHCSASSLKEGKFGLPPARLIIGA